MNVDLPQQGWYVKYCTALWDDIDQQLRVVMRLVPIQFAGDYWDVVLIDKKGSVVRRGMVHCQVDDTPYCLLEINSDTEALPPAYRKRWTLAVGLVNKFEAPSLAADKPFRFIAGSGRATVDKSVNWIDVQPVEWDDAPHFTYGTGILGDGKCEIRAAETSLAKIMTVQMVNDSSSER
jgi:hypothetical protein